MRTNALSAVLLSLLLVLAGCGEAVGPGGTGSSGGDGQPGTDIPTVYDSLALDAVVRPGPTDAAEMDRLNHEDVIGWEAGYWHNDSIDVDLSDGLSEAEAGPYLARAMARVEYLRGVEFTREVTMGVSTYEEYLAIEEGFTREAQGDDPQRLERLAEHERQIDEALFVIGADEPQPENSEFVPGGYYAWGTDRIQVFRYDGDHTLAHPSGVHPFTFRETLVIHELVHALQDEYADRAIDTRIHGGLDSAKSAASLLEGEAEYVVVLYAEQCDSGAWECVAEPPNPYGADPGSVLTGPGVFTEHAVGFLYLDGVAFVDHLYTEGIFGRTGWDAVDYAYQNQPRSTEQIIHPAEFPFEPALFVYVPENSWNDWKPRFNNALGERLLYSMFWYQDREHGIPVVDSDAWYNGSKDTSLADRYVYESTPSVGWAGDRFVNFQRGEENAYSWTIQFDTVEDAAEFHTAYLQVLEGHGGEQVGEYTWVIPDGQFADAFYVEHRGTQVVIVNAPTVDDLGDVNPSIAFRVDTGR